LSVFFDRKPTIWKPVHPVLDGDAQPRGGGVEFGIATEQLTRRVPDLLTVILVK
jgi:hypothetical protein